MLDGDASVTSDMMGPPATVGLFKQEAGSVDGLKGKQKSYLFFWGPEQVQGPF